LLNNINLLIFANRKNVMKMRLFNSQIYPLIVVLNRIFKFYSNLFENIVGVYTDNSFQIQSYSSNKKNLPLTESVIEWIKEYRTTSKTAPLWLNPATIPLFKTDFISYYSEHKKPDSSNKSGGQDILSQLKETTLMLFCSNFYEPDKNDLIILYPKTTSNNPLLTSFEKISYEQKLMVATLIEGGIKSALLREYETHTFMDDLVCHQNDLSNLLEKSKDEQSQSKEKQLEKAYYILGNLSKEHGVHLSFSEGSQQVFKNFKGDLSEIEKELKKAVNVAINTLPQKDTIELSESYLAGLILKNIEENKSVSSKKTPHTSTADTDQNENNMGQITRARKFLDRLNAGAKITVNNNEKLLWKNVSANMGVFPPAITDHLKRHKSHIKKLMSEEPLRWSSLRGANFPLFQNFLDSIG